MRRSFKEHICAFCELKQYNYSADEYEGRWVLRIENYIKIFSDSERKNWYTLVDNIYGIACNCRASAWEVMTWTIEELMNRHLKNKS